MSKFAEVDFNHSVRFTGTYSPYYGGCLVVGNFQSLTVPPVNGQTISYGNVAIAKPNGILVRLDNGLPEQTTTGYIVGEEIYVGTISGNVYKYTPNTGWNLLFSANAKLYNIVAIDSSNLLFVGEFTSINGSSYQYIANYNTQSEMLDSINGHLPFPLSESQVVTTSTTAYITWMNTTGMGSGLYALNKGTLCLTAVSNPATNMGNALTVNEDNVYFSGIDVNNNERRVWKIESNNTVTELFTLLGGGPAISGMTVYNGNLYFTGYFTGTSISQTVNDAGIYSLTAGTVTDWYTMDDNVPLLDITTANGNLLASAGWALYTSAQLTTGIPESSTTTALKIYPNPASAFITVTTSERTPLVFTNSIGQKLFETTAEKGTHYIDVTNFQNGTCFLNGKPFLVRH